ncbi:TetR/AcrR family transcriptional regulator [Actinomycetospora endophytica]|uniref:TetR/AcrR family transcriptional regulator n=1 Tax=Actinomycetospora endophytica TaxID=2291215 RepID=A0ABS8PDJ1_9PSEU|nr:TetR/AcrR family transcriptional regulator [Actinomycetospora endophytica]MCD2196336.1 TetR/AcrR family transcriptional regulator [Actinomycetospora endophytica]
MRADAQRNRSRIVDAARDLVARDGVEVRMDDLAAQAGVAVGTLYRHFPTKTALVDAVVEESVAQLAHLAGLALERAHAGGSAWEELEGVFAAISEGYSARAAVERTAELLGLGDESSGTPAPAAEALRSLQTLVGISQAAGEMRDDVTLTDLLLLLARAPEKDDVAQRSRYIELVSDGLRPRAGA